MSSSEHKQAIPTSIPATAGMRLKARGHLQRVWKNKGMPIQADYISLIERIIAIDRYIAPPDAQGIFESHISKPAESFGHEKAKDVTIAENALLIGQLDEEVIDGIFEGNLPERFARNAEKMPSITFMDTRNAQVPYPGLPFIYANYIVKGNFEGVSCAALNDVCALLEKVTPDDLDSEGQSALQKLNEVFLEKKGGFQKRKFDLFQVHERSVTNADEARRKHTTCIKEWIRTIRGIIELQSNEGTIPMSEVGLTTSGDNTRFLAQRDMTSDSSILMKLVRCALASLFPGSYRITQWIIAYVESANTLSTAECAISILASSYINMGGFKTYPAGTSNTADKLTPGDWADCRETLQRAGVHQRRKTNLQRLSDLKRIAKLENDLQSDQEKNELRERDTELMKNKKQQLQETIEAEKVRQQELIEVLESRRFRLEQQMKDNGEAHKIIADYKKSRKNWGYSDLVADVSNVAQDIQEYARSLGWKPKDEGSANPSEASVEVEPETDAPSQQEIKQLDSAPVLD